MDKRPPIIFYGDAERYPILHPPRYSAIVNVADSPCTAFTASKTYQNVGEPIPYFWFPVHECGFWGYSAFYGAAHVYDTFAAPSGKTMLVHCHGGACRSPLISYAVLASNGWTDEEMVGAFALFGSSRDGSPRIAELFRTHIRKGCIPADVIEFLKARKEKPTFSIAGLLAHIDSPNLYLQTFNNP